MRYLEHAVREILDFEENGQEGLKGRKLEERGSSFCAGRKLSNTTVCSYVESRRRAFPGNTLKVPHGFILLLLVEGERRETSRGKEC